MTNSGTTPILAAARDALSGPLDFAGFLAKLTPKDRVYAERRVLAFEAEDAAGRAALWRRLACTLMTLAPHAAKFVGRQTVQFYVADGKYRKQVFALEDLQDGNMTVYCPNVLQEAVEAGLLEPAAGAAAGVGPAAAGALLYAVGRSTERLVIDLLDGSTLHPAAHFKDMTGWNRKALRVTLPPSASPAQVEAVELLCAMAAVHFVSGTATPR